MKMAIGSKRSLKLTFEREMFMKFVGFNLKEPKVSNRYGNILDDLRGEL